MNSDDNKDIIDLYSRFPKYPSSVSKEKCMLSNNCNWRSPCRIHGFLDEHDTFWYTLKLGLGFAIVLSCIVIGVSWFMDFHNEQATKELQNLSCIELLQYIADFKTFYDEAEHRYQWLCVNEKAQEFQK